MSFSLSFPASAAPPAAPSKSVAGAILGIKTVPVLNCSLGLKLQFVCLFFFFHLICLSCLVCSTILPLRAHCLFFMPDETVRIMLSAFSRGDFLWPFCVSGLYCSFCKSSSVRNEHIPLFRFISFRIINFICSFLNGALKRVLQSCSGLRSSFTCWTYRQLYTHWISRTQREAALHQFVLFTFGSYLSSCKRWELNFWIFNSAKKSCFNCKTC